VVSPVAAAAARDAATAPAAVRDATTTPAAVSPTASAPSVAHGPRPVTAVPGAAVALSVPPVAGSPAEPDTGRLWNDLDPHLLRGGGALASHHAEREGAGHGRGKEQTSKERRKHETSEHGLPRRIARATAPCCAFRPQSRGKTPEHRDGAPRGGRRRRDRVDGRVGRGLWKWR